MGISKPETEILGDLINLFEQTRINNESDAENIIHQYISELTDDLPTTSGGGKRRKNTLK